MCIMLMMRRIQIHLEEEIDEALARQARQRAIPKAALIREYLAQHVDQEAGRMADASSRLIGGYQGAESESASIGQVLYGDEAG